MRSVLVSFLLTVCLIAALPISAVPASSVEKTNGLTQQTRKMGGPIPAEQLAVSFEHLDLAIKVYPYQKRVEADATLSLIANSRLRQLVLDLYPNFQIISIRINEAEISERSWSNREGQIRIDLPAQITAGEKVRVDISYAGFPHVAARPPWEGGMVWSETENGTPWVGSSHWGGGCDLLWPCIDHPTRKPGTADLRITVPVPLVAPANGVLLDVSEDDGWRTYHWRARSPHTYGLVLNVGPYDVLTGHYESRYGNSIPMKFWYLPEDEDRAKLLFQEFPRILEFFETRIGPYPWADQKMGVVQTPHKGMEHQTINAYGNDFKKTPYGFDSLLQHEFSHEYFANQLSVDNYDDLWLHEGFGSYMQPLYGQYLYGDMDYFAMLKSTRSSIRNDQPLVTGTERSEKEVYADESGPRGDIYSKGSLIIHTLRSLIGDEAFFESVRILVYGRPDPAPGNFNPQFRSTADYERIVNDVVGEDLSWFFDLYFYQADLPRIEQAIEGDQLTIEWDTPESLPFPMPLDVRIENVTRTLDMSNGPVTIAIPKGSHVTVDPHSKVLRQSDAIDDYQRWQASQEESKD